MHTVKQNLYKVRRFKKKNREFSKFNDNRIFEVMRGPTEHLGPIGSAVLTFIGLDIVFSRLLSVL